MRLLKKLYEKRTGKPAPYYYNYSLLTVIAKPIRKWLTNVVAANCPFNCIHIFLYRLCGFEIGKNVFIGMRCYLDDVCYDMLKIADEATISYGVYFACHGRKQGHTPIVIEEYAYIGMRASVISRNAEDSQKGITIGAHSMIGAGTLVNRDIPPYATAVGVPCRVIEKVDADEK